MDDKILSIEEAFGDLEAPRSRTPAHDLSEMLAVALCAILCGADNWVAIQLWGEAKLDWLRRYLPLPRGIPSHDTFGRVCAALNPRQFEACFMRWTSHLFPPLADQVVAIDGKTVRRSHDRGQRAIHLVSAYGAGLGMVPGQVRTAEKSNEITAIPELLDALWLQGAIVTIDAMGCQREIADKIVQAKANYVLAIKENQATAFHRIRRTVEALERLPKKEQREFISEHGDIGKDHGRIETRRCTVIDWKKSTLWRPGLTHVAWPSSMQRGKSATPCLPSVATLFPACRPTLPKSPTPFAHIGRSKTACTGRWTLPLAKTSAGSVSRTPPRTLPSCGASP